MIDIMANPRYEANLNESRGGPGEGRGGRGDVFPHEQCLKRLSAGKAGGINQVTLKSGQAKYMRHG